MFAAVQCKTTRPFLRKSFAGVARISSKHHLVSTLK